MLRLRPRRDQRGMRKRSRVARRQKIPANRNGSDGTRTATSGVTGRRSNQLNYDPAREALYRRLESSMGGDGIEPPTSCL